MLQNVTGMKAADLSAISEFYKSFDFQTLVIQIRNNARKRGGLENLINQRDAELLVS